MPEIKCNHCGYEWNYKGRLIKPTCPSCRRAVKVAKERVGKSGRL